MWEQVEVRVLRDPVGTRHHIEQTVDAGQERLTVSDALSSDIAIPTGNQSFHSCPQLTLRLSHSIEDKAPSGTELAIITPGGRAHMAGVEFTAMDFALLQRLYALRDEQPEGLTPAELQPLVQEQFPESDHVEMREGISITRLRGRGLVEDSTDGRVRLTAEGAALAAGLET
jgi:hypothetical protein